ncbi:hypothetical protein RhiJN_25921 [Ceratobasidium sp. AG-Ba]|nr:hypothetical protein RhiJN_25921 [Ceratobasidium sp. AG-Ba]
MESSLVRVLLAEKLRCEIVNIEVKDKYYSVFIPPNDDHDKDGKESEEDKKFKIAAEEMGVLPGKLKWVFLKKSEVSFL